VRATLVIAVGLVVAGIGNFGFLVLGARTLQAADYATLITWWAIATIAGLAMFAPFEAVLPRDAAHARDDATLSRILVGYGRRAGVVMAIIAVSLAILSPMIAPAFLGDQIGLVLTLGVQIIAMGFASLQRGAAFGLHRPQAAALQFAVEGAARIGLTGIAMTVAHHSLLAITAMSAAAVVAGIAAAALLGSPIPYARRGSALSPKWRELASLLASTTGAQVLVNGGAPLAAIATGWSAPLLAGTLSALTVARVPTLFASAAYGPLLPRLSASLTVGFAVYRSLLVRVILAAAGFGAICTTGFFALGPLLVEVFSGGRYSATHIETALFGLMASLIIIGVIPQAGLVSQHRSLWAGASWAAGAIAFPLVFLLSSRTPIALGVSASIGCAIAIAPMAVMALRRPG
jgi:O-antigen/teichoic acid export membrane protein